MIRVLLNIYIFIILVNFILNFFPKVRHNVWVMRIKTLADFSQKPIRKILPFDLPIDVSPLIVIIGIKLFEALW